MHTLRNIAAALSLVATAPITAQSLFERAEVLSPGLPALPTGIAGIVAGDIDQDSDQDLVTTEGSTTVIYRQQAGGFTRQTLTTGPGVPVRAVADFDADGFVDLLAGPIGNLLTASLRIWWGDAGGFPGQTTTDVVVPSSTGVVHVLAADADGDGDLDILFTSTPFFGPTGNVLLRNNGNRAFATASPGAYPTLATGQAEAFLVDLDGDGLRDVVLVSRDAETRLYWNNGGFFVAATPAQFPVVTSSHRGLAAADFDGDNDVDLVLGGHDGDGLLLQNTAVRTFAISSGAPTRRHTVALHAADRDGDGDVDLFVFGRTRNVELSNTGTGTFVEHRAFGGADDTTFLLPVDLDADGDRDWLRVGNRPGSLPVPPARVAASYEVQPGRYEHVGETLMPARASGSNPEVGDIDDDAFPDLLVAIDAGPAGSTIQFARHNGTGSLGYDFEPRIGGLANGFFADLNGDGRDEYVFTAQATGVLSNVDKRLALVAQPLPVSVTTHAGIAIDIDLDGDQDLVFASQVANVSTLIVLVNGQGTWTDETAARIAVPSTAGSYPDLRHADFDGDLDQDLWFHTNSSDRIYHNDGNGVFTWRPNALPPQVVAWSPSSTGDLDGDSDIDLSLGRFVLINDGTGTFSDQSASVPNVLEATSLGRIVDLDDDGKPDIVGQGYVLWNDGTASFSASSTALPFPYGIGIGARTLVDTDLDGDPDLITNEDPDRGYYLNMLRQSSLVQPGKLGGTLQIRYEARPASTPTDIAVWMFASFGKIEPLLLGACGWLQIDPLQAAVLDLQMLPSQGGTLLFEQAVPNAPSLLGTRLCAQSLDLRGQRMRLGNLVETFLGR